MNLSLRGILSCVELSSHSLTLQLGWVVWRQVFTLDFIVRREEMEAPWGFLLCEVATPQRRDIFKTSKLV